LKFEILGKPAYSAVKIELESGESITAEAGAMMAMEGDIEVETKTAGGIAKGLLRKIIVGETLFLNVFKAGPKGGAVWLAPEVPGDIKHVKLEGEAIIVQDTSYLGHYGEIEQTIAWRGLKGVLAEGSLFWLKLRGYGGIWLNSYGHIIERDMAPGEEITVDNFHFVAMSNGMKWKIKRFGGFKSFLFGGEGFVVEVKGPGKLFVQTRTIIDLAETLRRFIPRKR